MFKLTVIESPFAGETERNLAYVRAAMRDSLRRGEAPYASHALYTQPGVLDDTIPEERDLGIRAGFAYRQTTELTAVYADYGLSTGMKCGINHALEVGHPIEYRMFLRGATQPAVVIGVRDLATGPSPWEFMYEDPEIGTKVFYTEALDFGFAELARHYPLRHVT